MGFFKILFVILIICALVVWFGYDRYQSGETIINEKVDKYVAYIFQAYDFIKEHTGKEPVCVDACILTSDDYETVNLASDECTDSCIDKRGYLRPEQKMAGCFEEYEYDVGAAQKSRTYVRTELNKMIVDCEQTLLIKNTMDEDCLFEVMRAGVEPFEVCAHIIE